MGISYSVDNAAATAGTINTNIGTPTNTGGTATISGILGDAAGVSIASRLRNKLLVNNSKTLSANNTTVSVPLWTITGSILIWKLYGVVTTVLGSNHTAAHWRLEDGTNTPAITLATGTTLSSANVGSIISKIGLASAALTLLQSDQTRVGEAATAGNPTYCPAVLVSKNGATTQINYRYTTTNTPTSGVIQFFLEYEPLSADGTVTAV